MADELFSEPASERILRMMYAFFITAGPFVFLPMLQIFDPGLDVNALVLRYFLLIAEIVTIVVFVYYGTFLYRTIHLLFKLSINPPRTIHIPVRNITPAPDIQFTPVAKTKTTTGYVYLLKSDAGFYKIGRTSDPNDRIRTFSVKLPFDVQFEHLIECVDMYQAERDLHQRFHSNRVKGEWFQLTSDDVAYIKTIDKM